MKKFRKKKLKLGHMNFIWNADAMAVMTLNTGSLPKHN